MTRAQADQARQLLSFVAAADSDGVLLALRDLRHADQNRTDSAAVVRALRGAQALAWRLIDGEVERTAFRSTVARLVVANNRGDDYSLSDLASHLEQAGIELKDDYNIADDLARATESEVW
ncbi:hypothetical protein ACFWFF_01380 [Streptomyces sp. NPDC060223]|uniref:hypothetical protein n=1 Tax=unclassified Streptomyces TaxID=2593676 RepID=UPI003644CC76